MSQHKTEQDRLDERSNYVKKIIAKSPSTHKAVEKLSKQLFVTERTIYRDLIR